jgi:ATP-dependent Clp protease ATP-binding subunit ClpA
MLSQHLEQILNRTFNDSRTEGVEFLTVEALLRGLLRDTDCRDLLVSLGADAGELESALDEYIESGVPKRPASQDVQPTVGFQRVLQRAVFHVQARGEKEVRCLDVLAALFGERTSSAVAFLTDQGIDQEDVMTGIGVQDGRQFHASVATGWIRGTTSQSSGINHGPGFGTDVDRRIDELEIKLDTAIGEIRQISENLKLIMKRLPPNA